MARKRRGLRPEEVELWQRVAETARPLHPACKPTGRHQTDRPSQTKPVPGAAPAHRLRRGEAVAGDATRQVIQPGLSVRIAGQPVRMDRKTFTRMTRGKLKPEAKIDLHGMTLAEAHPALIRLILGAHADGVRLVLVVTGKGRDFDQSSLIPATRGVLRRQVPLWLSQAPLSALVLQVTEAHRRHGGGGAYYVYLRRPPGITAPRR